MIEPVAVAADTDHQIDLLNAALREAAAGAKELQEWVMIPRPLWDRVKNAAGLPGAEGLELPL